MVRSWFLTRHGDLRIVWRILFFLVAASLFLVAGLYALSWTGLSHSAVAQSILFCCTLLAVGGLCTRFVNRKPFTAIGLHPGKRAFLETLLGCLLAFVMMAGIFVVELLFGLVTVQIRPLPAGAMLQMLLESGVMFAAAAVAEELLFRGYPFQSLVQGLTFVPAMLLVSVSFAVAHGGNPNIGLLALFNIFLAGVWLSFAYLTTRGLWLPIGLHFAWNFSQTTLFGFPTSGIAVNANSVLELSQSGAEWVTGGMFGPEGGVLATIALLLGTWVIVKTPRFRKEEGIVTLDSVEDLLPPGDGQGEVHA